MYDESKNEWILILNKYQRDNLLWLLNACGYPYGSGNSTTKNQTVEPFNTANTGDWLGELCLMLMGPSQWPGIVEGDRPNMSFEDLRKNVEQWARHWVKAHPEHITPGLAATPSEDHISTHFREILKRL